jgi:hypothetical protein
MNEPLTAEWWVEKLGTLPNNAAFSSLSQKSVLFVSSANDRVEERARSAGAATVVRLSNLCDRPNINAVCEKLQQDTHGSFERIFFDLRQIDSASLIRNFARLLAILRGKLTERGALFLTLNVGQNYRAFDVQNPCVLSGADWLPGRAYLFDQLLGNWAVRTMHSVSSVAPQADSLLLRLTPKRPTLLIVYGPSMSGKTTLAREFTRLNPHMHVSNDFIYGQLVQACKSGESFPLDPHLAQHLGDGSGQACGTFNRALEAVPGLMEAYLPHLVSCIPQECGLVSIDFDLRLSKSMVKVNQLLADFGFSVWSVQR